MHTACSSGGVHMRNACLSVLVLLTLAGTGFAQQGTEEAGVIEYFEGGLRLISGDTILDAFEIGFGEPVHLGETLETESDGRATVGLTGGVGATIDVGPSTAYTFRRESSGGQTRNSVNLIHGKIGVIVDSVSSDERFEVRSRSSVMGVRGTEFDVVTAADGSLLVGVREGRVETQRGQRSESLGAGEVIEVLSSGGLSKSTIPVDRLDDYYRIWLELRNEVFQSDPAFFVAQYLRQFDQARERFIPAARELLAVTGGSAPGTSGAGSSESGGAGGSSGSMGGGMSGGGMPESSGPPTGGMPGGSSGSNTDSVLDRMGQSPAMVRLRSALPLFEERYSVLADLVPLLSQSDIRGLSEENRERLRVFARERGQYLQLLVAARTRLEESDQFDLRFPGE